MADNDVLLQRKREIEAAFLKEGGVSLRPEYLGLLQKLNRTACGIIDFFWPGIAEPFYMRCGSSDLSNFIQIFGNKEYGFPLDFSPKRIIDLGGYVGYAAVFLARRFPQAELFSVEPSEANFQIHALNTAAYSRIRRLNVAVWGHSSLLGTAGNSGGDWANRLAEAADVSDGVPALSIEAILQRAGWNKFDFLKCDIEGAELSVFSESGKFVADMVDCCAIELHDVAHPGTSKVVKDCFSDEVFRCERSGEFHVFTRRHVVASNADKVRVSVLRPPYGIRRIELENVRDAGWAYYMFDTDSCQLHPGNRRGPPAELSTMVKLDGHSAFHSGVAVINELGHAVDFGIEVFDLANQEQVAKAAITVQAGTEDTWVVDLNRQVFGDCQIKLQTMMSKDSPTTHKAIANWLSPSFL
jgi:FkbM family methyltransferase